jgi:hypothetical protein
VGRATVTGSNHGKADHGIQEQGSWRHPFSRPFHSSRRKKGSWRDRWTDVCLSTRFETAVFFRQQGCWDEMQENNVDSDDFIIKIVEQHDCQHTGSDRRSSELGRYEVDKIVLDQLSSSALYAEQLIFSSRRASSVLSKQM